jgi:hypothetical protein
VPYSFNKLIIAHAKTPKELTIDLTDNLGNKKPVAYSKPLVF